METTKYSATLDLKSKIAVNRKLSVLANLRYYNLASCSIIYTEETKQEGYPWEFLRVHLKTRNEFPTSFFVPQNFRYTLRAFYVRLCWGTAGIRLGTWLLSFSRRFCISDHFHIICMLWSSWIQLLFVNSHFVNLRPQFIWLPILTSQYIKWTGIILKQKY